MTSPLALGAVLNKKLDDLGLFSKARKYQVYAIWRQVVGDIAANARPRRIDGDVLLVATSSSVWSQELTFMAPSILEGLNSALGGEYFRAIRFSEHLWRSIPTDELSRPQSRKAYSLPSSKRRRSPPSDKDLADTLSRLKSTMAKRVAFLRAQGYGTCPKCGYLYSERKGECPLCKSRREFYAFYRAIAILNRRPDLTNQAVMAAADVSDEWLVERARHELESRWLTFVKNCLSQFTRKERKSVEILEFLAKLASLRSGVKIEELGDEGIERALGHKLASILKDGVTRPDEVEIRRGGTGRRRR